MKNLTLYIKSLLSALYLLTFGLTDKKNRRFLKTLAGQTFPDNEGKIVQATLPKIHYGEYIFKSLQTKLVDDNSDGNVSQLESLIIGSLVQIYKPSYIFEIGTFIGRTTLTMAINEPTAKIFTLDLPKEEFENAKLQVAAGDEKYILKEKSGILFEGSPEAANIQQLYGDSATFDYSPYIGKMDFIFVDGAHSYEYLLSDTEKALQLLNPQGGIIIWHDYDTKHWPGVTKGLNELAASAKLPAEIINLEPTTIAIMVVNK